MSKNIVQEDVFENLEVLEDLGVDENNHHYYKTLCHKCGRITTTIQNKLQKNEDGCISCRRKKDYTGMIFNGWRAICPTGETNNTNNAIWLCECIHCGKKHQFSTNYFCKPENRCPKCDCQKKKRGKSSYKNIYSDFKSIQDFLNKTDFEIRRLRKENAGLCNEVQQRITQQQEILPSAS